VIGGSRPLKFGAEGFRKLLARLIGVFANNGGGLGIDIVDRILQKEGLELKDGGLLGSVKCECDSEDVP
jgi:hypothetical protein